MIRSIVFLILTLTLIVSIPFEDQLCLANSLIVGRDDVQDLHNWQCKVCDSSNKPNSFHIFEDKSVDVKCILSVYDDFAILAFRYTNTALNVWEDMLYPLQVSQSSSCSNCKVQKQFIKMWEKVKFPVLQDLMALYDYTHIKKLYITGISLGGGLSTISFMDIAQQTSFTEIKVTTFGAPRVGNKQWAAYYDLKTLGRTKRYLVYGDPIPQMPRCLTVLCSYHQVGVRIACYEQHQRCVQEREIPDQSSITYRQILNTGRKYLGMQVKPQPLEYGSIVDHIQGYPKIYNHTLIQF